MLPENSKFGKQSPLQRPAQLAEMAPAHVFLASEEASYITAEIMTGGTPLP
jgi:NAD(P)-dependent dehydrogenase (short-subunit alcohol dehydrogenase family)